MYAKLILNHKYLNVLHLLFLIYSLLITELFCLRVRGSDELRIKLRLTTDRSNHYIMYVCI